MDWNPRCGNLLNFHQYTKDPGRVHPSAIVSLTCRYRNLRKIEVGQQSIIDDFCYISTALKMGRYSHLGNGASITGGAARVMTIGDHIGIGPGCKFILGSTNLRSQLQSLHEPESHHYGDITLEDCSGIGSGVMILGPNTIPEGTSLGWDVRVLPNTTLQPWRYYAMADGRLDTGMPRDKVKILEQRARAEEELDQENSIGAG